jgi:hypothetical protein
VNETSLFFRRIEEWSRNVRCGWREGREEREERTKKEGIEEKKREVAGGAREEV